MIVLRNGKTLDIPGGSISNGARVETYEINGDSNQGFIFRSVSANSAIVPSNSNASTTSIVGTLSLAGRRALKPGWNMFSPQQDIEMGQQAAVEVSRQIPILNDSRVDNYINDLGQRLAATATASIIPTGIKS